MKLQAYDHTGKKLESWTVPAGLGKANLALLKQAIRVYQTNSHQGGSKVKTRGEVQGSTRKIYRQKGTGNARHGARYAPVFVGGGVAHGPTGVRAGNLVLPKKMRRAALSTALVVKLDGSELAGLQGASKLTAKSASAAELLGKITGRPGRRTLVVTKGKTEPFYRAARNLQGVNFKRADLISAYDLVAADFVLVTRPALTALVARAQGQSEPASKSQKSTINNQKSK